MRSCLKPVIFVSESVVVWVRVSRCLGERTPAVSLMEKPRWCCIGSVNETTAAIPRYKEQWWQDLIPLALVKWNAVDANFMFHTRPLRSTDDPVISWRSCRYSDGRWAAMSRRRADEG